MSEGSISFWSWVVNVLPAIPTLGKTLLRVEGTLYRVVIQGRRASDLPSPSLRSVAVILYLLSSQALDLHNLFLFESLLWEKMKMFIKGGGGP